MTTATTVRRGLFGMFAGGLLAFGSAAIIAPVASAQPAPGPAPAPDCSASSVAGTVSTAAASEGAYLTANPQTNEALTQISAEPQPQAKQAYMAYFAENPQVEQQLKAIHEPVSALKDRCGLTVSPTPVAQAVWSTDDQAPEVPVTPAPGAPTAPMEPEMPTA
ncbi:hemophore-related protein [Mycobacterium sp. BK558]|nr:hemophore-related protein [Mycobacterium sp. BK558]